MEHHHQRSGAHAHHLHSYDPVVASCEIHVLSSTQPSGAVAYAPRGWVVRRTMYARLYARIRLNARQTRRSDCTVPRLSGSYFLSTN
jgi:hypothetical protein